MTRWEDWIKKQKSRKDIICAVYDYDGTGRCGSDCILYPVCKEEYGNSKQYELMIKTYLDEPLPTRDAVIQNLSVMLDRAMEKDMIGYAVTLRKAIELLKEG